MTIDTQQDSEQAAVEAEPVDVVAETLRHYMLQEHDQADRYATTAAHHRNQAATLENQAMQCRTREEEYRRLLVLKGSRPADLPGDVYETDAGEVDDQGNVQTVLFQRPAGVAPYPFPLVRGYRRCNGCQSVIRPATPEETEAANACRDLPDVRRECPDCGIEAAARRMPYTPATPPDAA